MKTEILNELIAKTKGALEVTPTEVKVKDINLLKSSLELLVHISATDRGKEAAAARYLVRGAALDLGIIPSSIHDLCRSSLLIIIGK